MRGDLLRSVFELPDLSFIDNDTIEDMMSRLVSNYETRYKEITGETVSLAQGDPNRILLYAIALDLIQIEEYVDRAGKQDLLKYSYGDFLDHLAAARGVTRKQPSAAMTTLRFHVSDPRTYALGIPEGTRATNGNGVYFVTSEYAEAEPGAEYVDAPAVCTVMGAEGNGFLPGQINVIVDPLPYIEAVENLTLTEGGADLETDESLAERTYLAPSSYSTAGPSDAYMYWARTYNAGIMTVKPTTPAPGQVALYLLMKDGALPEQEILDGLEEYLASNDVRPMTDLVSAHAPTVREFGIDLTYYIYASDSSKAVAIQNAVNQAISDFLYWQETDIGLDLNPDELVHRIIQAGAKRVEVREPAFRVIGETEVAKCKSMNITYGGLEHD